MMLFYRISELMLPTFIQRCDKNHFIFIPFKNERLINWNDGRQKKKNKKKKQKKKKKKQQQPKTIKQKTILKALTLRVG